MSKPRLLDLFCGAGGAGMGYARAGFDVVGIDIRPQRRYPFRFHQADAMVVMDPAIDIEDAILGVNPIRKMFDAIHASPPCQRFTKAQRLQKNDHPDLLTPMRELLIATGLPYVIENVEDALPVMRNPTLLCGAAFPDLGVYRHRLFETSFELPLVLHAGHGVPLTKLGHSPIDGNFMHVVGHFPGVPQGRVAMGIDWMTQNELAEAIPPAYTEWVGGHLMSVIEAAA